MPLKTPALLLGWLSLTLLQAMPTESIWRSLVRSAPEMVGFLILVWIFIRHMENRDRAFDELVKNNTMAIRDSTRVLGSTVAVMEETKAAVRRVSRKLDREP